MQISQSRAANRGPLIAVIKIQLSSDNIDRIFLHQNDDDYRLAEEFQQKHRLNVALIDHIHERIRLSRLSLQQQQSQKEQKLEENRQSLQGRKKNENQKYQPLFSQKTPQNRIEGKKIEQPNLSHYFEESGQSSKLFYKEQQSSTNNKTYLSKNFLQALNYQKSKIAHEQKMIENYPPNYSQFSKSSEINEKYELNESKPRVKIIRREEGSRRESSMRKSQSKTQVSRISKNVTNRLYNETQIKKNYLKRIKEKALTDKQEKQVQQLTHKPKINPISKIIAEGRHENVGMYEYLVGAAKRTEVKLQNERIRNEQREKEGCSFKPQLNPISRKLTHNRSQRMIESQLKNERCSKKHGDDDKNFRPSLNKISKQIVKDKGNFQQRMKTYLQQKNMKLNKMNREKYLRQKIDKEGQQLFRPRISSTRQPKGSQIYEYLYEMNKQNSKIDIEEKKPVINEHSDFLVKQIHKKRMAWLFSELDSDQDGLISSKRINIETINEDILEIIMPVLFEMEEMNIELTLSQFTKAIENLHLSLNANEKSILYNYSHSENQGKGVKVH